MEYKGIFITPKMYQRICTKEHFMVKFKGFGVSQEILEQLETDKVKFIMFIYMGATGNKAYFATTKQFLSSEKTHKFGEDLQRFLSIDEMLEY